MKKQQYYFTYGDRRIYLVSARARLPSLENEAVRRLRDLVRLTESEVPGVNAAITGEVVLEFDEMAQSQRDTTLATLVSLALVALIFIYGYSESGRPLKATFCLVIGLGYTMGFATLVIGHLNILTITFVPMLIGLAIDFGVHLITRYEDVVAALKDPRFSSDTRDAGESNRLDAWWIPKVFTILADSMITNNDPAHQRQRNLVHLAFTPRRIEKSSAACDSSSALQTWTSTCLGRMVAKLPAGSGSYR